VTIPITGLSLKVEYLLHLCTASDYSNHGSVSEGSALTTYVLPLTIPITGLSLKGLSIKHVGWGLVDGNNNNDINRGPSRNIYCAQLLLYRINLLHPYTTHSYTIHHPPYTIHHTPSTIHHTPYTRCHQRLPGLLVPQYCRRPCRTRPQLHHRQV
jgi:hypothetical protein